MAEPTPHEQDLLAEIPWLRQLARELAGDFHRREDLVQDACRVALEQPPSADGRGRLRAWLRAVMRNASWLGQRSRARLEERERSCARPEATESAGELAARAELQRRLLAEVLALREPLRQVLLLRYYRGSSTAAIAAALGLSEDAVRQRQTRALAALRERTRGDDGLRDLLSLAGVLPEIPQVPVRVLGLCAALVGALVAALWVPAAAWSSGSREELAAIAVPSGTTLAVASDELGSPRVELERAPAQEPAPLLPWLTVHARDARTQEPLAGATIARARAKDWEQLSADVEATWSRLGIGGRAGSFLGLSLEEALPDQPGTEGLPPFAPIGEVVVATTDTRGLATLTAPLPDSEFLVIRAEGRGARSISVAEARKLELAALRVELRPVADVPVRVRTLEGAPVEDAFLRLEAVAFLPQFQPQPTLPLLDGLAWHGPTGEDGTFLLEDVPCDEALVATPLSKWIGKPADLLVTAGAPVETLDLVVAAHGSISGRVVDAQGRALAAATVYTTPRRPWYDHFQRTTTNEEGVFRLRDLPAGIQELQCAPDYAGGILYSTECRMRVVVEPFSTTDVGEYVVDATAICAGRVRGFEGANLQQFHVELLQRSRSARASQKPDGTFLVRGDPGPGRLIVVLRAEWHGGRQLLQRDVVLPCEELELDVTGEVAALRFQLEGDSEAPAWVSACPYDHALDSSEGWPGWEGSVLLHEVRCAAGGFRIEALPPGRHRLELSSPDGARTWTGEVELRAGHATDLGALRMDVASLNGFVEGAPSNAEVVIRRRVPERFVDGVHHQETWDIRRAPVAEDGAFRFDGLCAGLWCATATASGAELCDGTTVDLRCGAHETLRLRASRAPNMRARVVQGGVPVVGACASTSFARPDSMRPFFELNPVQTLNPSGVDGWIDLGTFFPGPYRVTIEANGKWLAKHVDIAWNDQVELEFDLGWPKREIVLQLPDAMKASVHTLRYHATSPASAEGLQTIARLSSMAKFEMNAPDSEGYLEFNSDEGSMLWPISLPGGVERIEVFMPSGEVLVRAPAHVGSWGLPAIQVVELPGTPISREETRYGRWPLEPLQAGVWLARGIPDGSLLCFTHADQRLHADQPDREVRFDTGRLEVSWP